MWNQSITIDILADELITELFRDTDGVSAIQATKKMFPDISETDAVKITQLAFALISKTLKSDNIEIVATTPISFLAKTRKTRPVMQELISCATKSILITGYSISNHFEDMIKVINDKSKQGIVVEMELLTKPQLRNRKSGRNGKH